MVQIRDQFFLYMDPDDCPFWTRAWIIIQCSITNSEGICWVSGSGTRKEGRYNVLDKSDRPSFLISACNFFPKHLVLAISVLNKYHERVIGIYNIHVITDLFEPSWQCKVLFVCGHFFL
jgi:hypothetical protein